MSDTWNREQPRQLSTQSHQACAFGERAELYDQVRPGYSDELLNDIVCYANVRPGMQIVEVGAGTGQATVSLARLGLQIHCIEPDRRMAELLRKNTVRTGAVEIDVKDFECCDLPSASQDLLIAAQSWHWIDPDIRLRIAADILRPGGAIAVFWHERPRLGGALREFFTMAHNRFIDELTVSDYGSTQGRMQQAFGGYDDIFCDVRFRRYHNSSRYAADAVIGLLDTYVEYHNLPGERRRAFYDGLRRQIITCGGMADVEFATVLHMARRTAFPLEVRERLGDGNG